jgi:hypothetical protein
MSSFTTALDVEFIDGKNWRVTAPFTYEVGQLGSGRFVYIPAGFITDFASVPRGLWNLFPPTGSYGRAAVVHDYLYRGGYITSYAIDPATKQQYEIHSTPDRGECDGILKEAMEASGVGRFTRWTVWAGVRVGGHGAYTQGHDVSKK